MNVNGSVTQWAEKFVQVVESRRQEAAGETEPTEKTERQQAAEDVLMSGEASKNHLARLVLGGDSQLGQWSEQGLDVSDASLETAYQTLNEAMSQHAESGTPSAIDFNAHQMVADSQAVPDWFGQEHADKLAGMDDAEAKAAFEAGEYFHLGEAGAEAGQQNASSGAAAYQAMAEGERSLLDQLFG